MKRLAVGSHLEQEIYLCSQRVFSRGIIADSGSSAMSVFGFWPRTHPALREVLLAHPLYGLRKASLGQ